jgi:glycerol uptake facilitator protein
MTSPFLGEFLGTMVLVLLGNGVVAGVVLKRSKAEGSGWMVITAGWAFAVMAGVFTAIACGSNDAHLNPAVTLGFAVRVGDFSKVAPYVGAQLLGAAVGAALVWLH